MAETSKTLVLYHANCPDGFCAAWAAHNSLKDNAEYLPVQYGTEPPDTSGRDVVIVDFSYKRPVMASIIESCNSLVVLDHHKTAEKELAGLGDGNDKCRIWYDMDRSGARMAWDYFCPDRPVPWVVDYVEDRDLWRWKLGHSREISAAIASRPLAFEWFYEYAGIHRDTEEFRRLVDEGAAILRYQETVIESAVKNASEIELAGHKVLTVNTTVLFSEVAGRLAEGRPFGATYFIRSDGKRQWSLRSRDGGVDVSEIAKMFGGGGHRNAAGFEDSFDKVKTCKNIGPPESN